MKSVADVQSFRRLVCGLLMYFAVCYSTDTSIVLFFCVYFCVCFLVLF